MDHWQLAQKNLLKAEDNPGANSTCGLAGIATAHAVLALLDYIQQDDDEAESEDFVQLHRRITQLEADLEAARKALRDRETITAAEMNNTPWSVE